MAEGNVEIILFDSMGKIVLTKNAISNIGNISERIAVSDFTSGIYLLNVSTSTYSKTLKVVIQ